MLMTDTRNEDTEGKKHALEDYMTIAQAIRHSGYTDQYLRRMAKEGGSTPQGRPVLADQPPLFCKPSQTMPARRARRTTATARKSR
jgi:hypothetical protein